MGMLDEVMRGLGKDLIDLFVDNEATLIKRVTTYDEITDTETTDDTTEVLKVSPPFPYDTFKVDDKTILADDLMVLVPAKVLDELSFSLDVVPNSETTYFLTIAGVTYSLMNKKRYASGDQVALYELQLRN